MVRHSISSEPWDSRPRTWKWFRRDSHQRKPAHSRIEALAVCMRLASLVCKGLLSKVGYLHSRPEAGMEGLVELTVV